jgi:hypothetical protein
MVAASAIVVTTGCDDWLTVKNPTVIDAGTVDPVEDAPTFARSAMNNLFDAFDDAIVYGAWFSGEAWEGDSFPTRTDVGRRNIDYSETTGTTNSSVNGDVYAPLARAIATGERVQELLADASDVSSNINIARSAFASGYGIQLEAELFCQVVISSGPHNLGAPLTSQQGAAEAEKRFRKVIEVGTANGTTEGKNLAMAAQVGLARALLFQGKNGEAATEAAKVPADFKFEAPKLDDASYRAALGNTVYSFTLARPALVVPPYYRDLKDSRVTSELGPSPAWPLKAQDNFLDFYRQTKYKNWDADIRLASGLEARYIAAEAMLKAGDPGEALALIAERKAAGGADAAAGPGGSTLKQLLDQKARDFYLEGTHMGDWRRNPDDTPYVPASGTDYYNTSEGGKFGTQTCMPMPSAEVLNNDNFK